MTHPGIKHTGLFHSITSFYYGSEVICTYARHMKKDPLRFTGESLMNWLRLVCKCPESATRLTTLRKQPHDEEQHYRAEQTGEEAEELSSSGDIDSE